MVKHLKISNKQGKMWGSVRLSVALVLVLFAPVAALAGTQGTMGGVALADPTRPPGQMTAVDTSGEAPAAPGLVLQSVMFSPTKVSAMISGQMVKVGDMVGDAKVIRIREGEVVVKSGEETKVLKLFPNVEKQLSPQRGGLRIEGRRP